MSYSQERKGETPWGRVEHAFRLDGTPPDEAQLQRLYAAALQLRAQAPWQWLDSTDLFGVRCCLPGDKTERVTGYISPLGSDGEAIGLNIYLGEAGFDVWRRTQTKEISKGCPLDVLGSLDMLSVQFKSRLSLSSNERASIRQSGVRFRGRDAWPQFYSVLAGCLPSPLNRGEAEVMIAAMEQAVVVGSRMHAQPASLDTLRSRILDSYYLLRAPASDKCGAAGSGGDSPWKDVWQQEPQRPERPVLPVLSIDEDTLEKVRTGVIRTGGEWEMHVTSWPVPVELEGFNRSAFPRMVLFMERGREDDLGFHLMPPWGWEDQVLLRLVDTIRRHNWSPREIRVCRVELIDLLRPAMEKLGVKLTLRPMLEGVASYGISILTGFDLLDG